MEEIKVDPKAVERLKKRIIIQENLNLKTKIEEEVQCSLNQ